MEPITRKEVFLNALCADKSCGLEPVSREEILLKKLVDAEAAEGGGSGLPSGSKPNQYIVTDGEGNAKWEDKLCWIEKTKKVVLPETFVAEHAQPVGGIYGYSINSVLDSEKKYTVIYNGVAYDVISHTVDEQMVAMGNAALMGLGTDTGEPFIIAYNTDTGVTAVGALDGDGITISIFEVAETVHTIDKKFLPSGGSHLRVFITMDENENYLSSKTYEEIKNHVLNGGTCDCAFGANLLHLAKAAFLNDVQTFGRAYEVTFIGLEVDTLMSVVIRDSGYVYFSTATLSVQEN